MIRKMWIVFLMVFSDVSIINICAVNANVEQSSLNQIEHILLTNDTDRTDDVIDYVMNKLPFIDDIEFIHAFVESMAVILVSELGDKTFFIAAIMAMSYSKFVVFFGGLSALGLMTAISVGFGMAATIIPRIYTYYISTALLAISGLKMLYDSYKMSHLDAQKEFEEVQLDISRRETEHNIRKKIELNSKDRSDVSYVRVIKSTDINGDYDSTKVLMQAFSMTLLAEWGDRSQLTTIVLSAKEDAMGVICGGIAGHAICTGLAVLCGSMIAQRISVKTVTCFGGILFLIFALVALVYDPDSENGVLTTIS